MQLPYDTPTPTAELVAFNAETGAAIDLAAYPSIAIYYQRFAGGRPLAAKVEIERATLSISTAAWTSGGLRHDAEGRHRLDLPLGAAIRGEDGATRVVVTIAGHATIAAVAAELQLVDTAATIAAAAVAGVRTVATVAPLVAGSKTEKRGTTWNIELELSRPLDSAATVLYFTMRDPKKSLDPESAIQVRYNMGTETAELLFAGGAAAASSTLAELTISGADVQIRILPAATALVNPQLYLYDVKEHQSDADAEVLAEGRFTVSPDITRAVPTV
jgi:hypothetical protein